MKADDLLDSLEHVEPALVARADKSPEKKPRRPLWMGLTAVAAAAAILIGISLQPGRSSLTGQPSPVPNNSPIIAHASALAVAAYPEMAPYPSEADYLKANGDLDMDAWSADYDAWWADRKAQLDQPEGYDSGLEGYYAASLVQFLGGGGTENKVYSPLNLYFALGMLAELTDGNSRQQILDLLGQDSIETLRTQARALWNANYCDDGAVTSVLASSLWLNQDVPFVQSTLDTLADTYYASSYQGEMGSAEFNQALQAWLNDQTGGLLKEAAEQIRLDPETVLALATTVYYQGRWAQEFNPDNTAPDLFHTPEGDVTCDFMRQSSNSAYYWGERFSAVGKPVEGSGALWLILPDEGVSVDQLLADPEAQDFLLSNGDWDNQKNVMVNLSMPKFDVSGQIDLKDGLEAMGITDVFDPAVSDFTPMTTEVDEIYVSQVTHAARVMVDEEGLTAAAFTVLAAAGGAMPPEDEVDFTLDRPFLFLLTGAAGQPLFAGVVNQPA